MKRLSVILLLIGVLAANAATAYAGTATQAKWKNCTAVNKHYPHGVGKLHAHDHTTGVPVTNFRHSTTLYNTAMSYNRGLDRDHDGIACETQ